jgi:hypothetical protein
MAKPSAGDVLRALAEEVRERGVHPDREDVLNRYLDDDQDEQAPESPEPKKGGK